MKKPEIKVPVNSPEEIEQKPQIRPASSGSWQSVSLPLSILAAGLIITAGIFFNAALIIRHFDAQSTGKPDAQTAGVAAGQNAAPAEPVNIQLPENAPSLGLSKAPVLVVEYADYQCPFCEKFYTSIMPQLKKDYIDKGKVRFVYQDYAFLGPDSGTAAEAARCAADQGKFWEYHDYLFTHQGQENSGWASSDKQKGFAKSLGLNVSQFGKCLDDHKYSVEVQNESKAALGYGVSGTPTVFVNGVRIVGAQSYATFQQAIETALK
ncbi:MAG: DsbA family protein [Patescibacteria group bacterium]|nr:DsbA family protein [Patescibacteria group bacterium]